MRAIHYSAFGQPLDLVDAAEPEPPTDGVVIEVQAAGLCRSDWHGWQGHDSDIRVLPHVPGHEFAGIVTATGPAVTRWRIGDRVTAPFVVGCGACATCEAGDGHVCPDQWQPGFHGAGAFAERVAIPRADANLVRLPDAISMSSAALLGCRFATGFRAAASVGAVDPADDVVVLGCGGLGLAIVMVCAALGAAVTAVDRNADARDLARICGAQQTVEGTDPEATLGAIHRALPQGASVSFDATGSIPTARTAVLALRPRGRHVQVGLLPDAQVGERASIPMGRVIARELTVRGSHGMAPGEYPQMLDFITSHELDLERLITRRIGLEHVPEAMATDPWPAGVTIIEPTASNPRP